MKEQIASAGNTDIPALETLRVKGYKISKSLIGNEDLWVAERHDLSLMAESPLALLGLAAMREARGPNWKPTNEEVDNFFIEFPDS